MINGSEIRGFHDGQILAINDGVSRHLEEGECPPCNLEDEIAHQIIRMTMMQSHSGERKDKFHRGNMICYNNGSNKNKLI